MAAVTQRAQRARTAQSMGRWARGRVMGAAVRRRVGRWAGLVVLGSLALWPALDGLRGALVADGAGMDFGIFVRAGRALATGGAPYATFGTPPWRATPYTHGPNMNPPASLLFFRALAHVPAPVAFRVWQGVSLACFVLVLALLLRAYRPRHAGPLLIWSGALAGLWQTLRDGNIYLPLVLLCTVAWLDLRAGRARRAGLLIGLAAAIKPQLLVWLGLLGLGGAALPALVGLAAWAGASALPLLLWGPGVYRAWLALLPGPFVAVPPNASLYGLLAQHGRLGLATPLCALLIVAAALLVRRARPDRLAISGLGLGLALLCSPITWAGYTLLLLPVFFARPWARGLWLCAGVMLLSDQSLAALSGQAPALTPLIYALRAAALCALLVSLARRAGMRPLACGEAHGTQTTAITTGRTPCAARYGAGHTS